MENPVTTICIVAGVVIERDDQYLLVQEKQERAYGLWNLPAGRVDQGDTIEQTAVKEAKEETGFDVELGKKIAIFHERAEEPVKHVFLATIVGGALTVPEDELLDVRWFSREEIETLQREGKLRGDWIADAIAKTEASTEAL